MGGVPDYSRRDAAFKLFAKYRNISRVSKELKIPIQTLHAWKKAEDWAGRLAVLKDKLKAQHEVIKKAEDNFIVEKDLARIKLIEVLEEKVAKALLEFNVEIVDFKDLMRAIEFIDKQKRLLLGEPTEREVNTVDVSFTREEDLDNNIKELMKYLGDKKPAVESSDNSTGES